MAKIQPRRRRFQTGGPMPCPGCSRGMGRGHAVCAACWRTVPAQLRQRWYDTAPDTPEREELVRAVLGCIIGIASRERRRAPHMSA